MVALLLGLAGGGCGSQTRPPSESPAPPPPPPAPPQVPPQDGVIQVTGTERIGWDQQPMSGNASQSLQFAVYLDFNRMALPDIRCTTRGDGSLDCSAQLPPMTPGLHVMQLASIGTQNGRLFESTRSQAIFVSKMGPPQASTAPAAAPAISAGAAPAPPPSPDATPADAATDDGPVRFERVAETSAAIADLAATTGGDLFAAERTGRIVLVRRGTSTAVPALELPGVVTSAGRGLFSMALHPEFARNGLVYLLYAAQTAAADPVFRIARGREVGGRIGELAVLLDAAPASPEAWGVLRFGPDRRLYVALGEGQERRSGAASYDGKLLRLDDDGRAANDNVTASPIAASVAGDPSGLLWTPARERMILRRSPAGSEILLSEASRDTSVLAWGPQARPAALAYVAGTDPAAKGYLYAGDLGGGLHRIPWPSASGRSASAPGLVIAREYGAVRAVAAAPDGSVYFGTANIDATAADSSTAVKDVIVRLAPRARDRR